MKNSPETTVATPGQTRPAGRPYTVRRNDPFPEIGITWIDADKIDGATRRTRRALKAQIEKVKRSMERYGNRLPILVTGADAQERHSVIDGHARLAAARLLGAERIPCIVVDDLPEAEIRRLALSLNRLQETGAWDEDALRLEINEIIEIDGDIEIPGFELPEIEALQFGAGDSAEPDPADVFEAPEPDAPAVSRAGDIFRLGEHVLICGSAQDGAALDGVLEARTVSALFTDPPYNVPINGHVRSSSGGFAEFAEASGEMSRAEFTAFLTEAIEPSARALAPGSVLFICMDWRHVGEMIAALEALGLALLNICVWVKATPGMGSLYRSQHEFVFTAKKPGASHRNNVALGRHGRNRSNVWSYAGATGGRSDADDDFGVHPTVKPIRMVMEALLDVTAPGDLVLDPFLGSGTTLLAAERTRRRCIGIEIEPRYVDLGIRRWEDMTGGRAVQAETGQDLAELARERGVDPGALEQAALERRTPSVAEPKQIEEDF